QWPTPMKRKIIGCVCTAVAFVASQLLADDAPATKLKSGIDMSGLDTSVRPQDDFYRYVNGGWIDKTEIPPDKSRWGSFYILREESAKQQREIIEQLAGEQDLPAGSEQKKIADLFASLMDEKLADELGAKPVQPQLKLIDGIKSVRDLVRVLAELE